MRRTLLLSILVSLLGSPCQAQIMTSAERELADVEQQLNDAHIRKDLALLERIYADEFYCIGSSGATQTRAERLASDSTNPPSTNRKTDNLRVRVYGDVGVVTGRLTINQTARLYTDVFVKRAGRWQIVNCQATLVPVK
jgi:hypothetical protein